MKPHLPLLLLSSLLAALSASAVSASYLADGVDVTDLASSERFYDVGKGYYWTWQTDTAYKGADTLYKQYRNFSFLGDLSSRISGSLFSVNAFNNLKNDGMTCGYQVPANMIQYWLSYYGPFYTGTEPLAYGYTYSRDYLERLAGTQSLEVGMLFYDSWKDMGNSLGFIGKWYFCGVPEPSMMKDSASAGGFFADYFSTDDIVYLTFDADDTKYTNYRPLGVKSFSHELVKGFGMEEEADGSYAVTRPGQIIYLSLVADNKNEGHAITCYGFETDADGRVTALKVTNSDDLRYRLLTLYVKENAQGYMSLYTDAACSELWEYSNSNWYINGVQYIHTPEHLVDLYKLYTSTDTELIWTGLASGWSADFMPATTDALPGKETGWSVQIAGNTYNSYYAEDRAVCFDDNAASTEVHILTPVSRSTLVPKEMHLHNAVKDYLFIGEDGDRLMPETLVIDGTGSATFRNLQFSTNRISYETYTLNVGPGARLSANDISVNLHGTLELSGGSVSAQNGLSFGRNATLRVSEISALSGAVTMQGGSVFDCVLSADNTTTALLSVTGSLTLGGTVKLEIGGSGLLGGERYRVCTVSSGTVETGDFFTEHGTLSFTDNTLWLTYREVPSYAWTGGSGQWSSTKFGTTAHDTVHADIEFNGGSGTITLIGQVAPHHLSLHGGTYTFAGTGASINCEGYVNIDGSANLTLDVPITSQGIILEDEATLTLKTGKNSTLNYISATEHTHLNFRGDVTYDLEDAGVLAGAISVGAGTTLDFRLAHDEYLEGAVTAVSSSSAIRFENASSTRDIVIYEVGDNMEHFQGTVYVGRNGAARRTTLSLDVAPGVGTYNVTGGSTLLINESCTINTAVTGAGTLALGKGAEFVVPVSGGRSSFENTLALDVQGSAEIGTESNRLTGNLSRELSVSGHLSLHVAGGATLSYDRVVMDGGSYTYHTTADVGNVTQTIEQLHIGKGGGSFLRHNEAMSAYYNYAGITHIGSLTGIGKLTLSGDHFLQMSFYTINGVGAAGFSGDIHVDNVGSYGGDSYHLTVLELGAGVYGGAAMLSNNEDDRHSRSALGITGDVTLGGLESEEWGEAYLYSGYLNTTQLDVNEPSPAGMITSEQHTLTLNTAANHHFAGELLGPVNLVKKGNGTQSFRGEMSQYNGSVTVSGGVLSFSHDVSVASALVENKARLMGAEHLSITDALVMNSGELVAKALTTTTASFTGQSAVQADSILATGTWTLNLGMDNLHEAMADIKSLNGAGSLRLEGGLNISYQTNEVASASYKILTLSSDYGTQLADLAICRNGTLISIGEEGSSPLYLQRTSTGGYDLMLDITDGTAPLPREEYAVLSWQSSSGTWSVGSGELSGDWSAEHENANFHNGDEVIFSAPATVSVQGEVAPSAINVTHDSGSVVFNAGNTQASIAGSTSLSQNGAGDLTINMANSYRGGTSVQNGTLTVGHASALGTGTVALSGGTLNTGSYAVKNAVIATGGTFCGTNYAGTLTVKGNVSLGSALAAGTLNLESGTLHGDVCTSKVTTLNARGGKLDGALTLDGGALNLSGQVLEVSGVLTLGGITRLGLSAYDAVGTYTLISANSIVGRADMLAPTDVIKRRNYGISIRGNELILTVSSAANALTWTDAKGTWTTGSLIGGTVYENGDIVNFRTAAAVTVSGKVAPGEIIVDSAAKVTFTSDKKSSGSGIIGEGSVTKLGAGMLTMNAGNTYSGGTVLNAGTLKATAADSFGSGTITVAGGTLDLGSKAVANDIVLAGSATLKGDAKYTGHVTVVGNATLSAKTSYKGMTTIGEDSSLTLGEKATMAGSISVEDGRLIISNAKGMTLAKNQILTLDSGAVIGLVTIGTGSTLIWGNGGMSMAPVLKGGTLNLGSERALTLSGAKAQVQFGDRELDLPGKGVVYTDKRLEINGGTVTVSAMSAYAEDIVVRNGATLKLSTGKVMTDNGVIVEGTAAVVNGATHRGDITVNGVLGKGTNIKLIDSTQRVALSGSGVMLGTIAGAGIVDVNADIDATAAKLTAARINLNNGVFTNTKGIKLAKGQMLNLGGASLNLGVKGALTTAAGTSLVVSADTTIAGALTLGGGELVLAGGSVEVHGLLTLGKPMTVTGSGTITYDNLKPYKGELSALFGGAEVSQSGNMLTITGDALDTSRLAPASLDVAPMLLPAPAASPVADAMVQADWGIIDAGRAFMGAVNTRHHHAALLDKGRGAAWVGAFSSSVRHGNHGVHHGSDGNIEGAAFGLEHAVSETGNIGLAVGRSKNRLAATGVTHLRQETAHVALYGQKQLTHGFTADTTAAYGDTETKLSSGSWSQKSAALTARLTHAQQLTDATAFRTFGGFSYEATDAGRVGSLHTGSVQNLRAELGAGVTHTAGKAHVYADASLTGDLIRHNPIADFGGTRSHGANPGRIGIRATVGGLYEFSDTWSGTASYSLEDESRSTSHTLNIGVNKTF